MKTCLQKKEKAGVLHRMEWPPQSPDLNIIEAVWDYLDKEKVKNRTTCPEAHLSRVPTIGSRDRFSGTKV